jgi:hypothetical protein
LGEESLDPSYSPEMVGESQEDIEILNNWRGKDYSGFALYL